MQHYIKYLTADNTTAVIAQWINDWQASKYEQTKLTKTKKYILFTEDNFRWDIRRKSWIFYGSTVPSRPRPLHCWGFEVTLLNTTIGMTPLEEWSARSTDIYLTTLNTHKRLTSMPRRDSKPQSQLANDRTHTRFRARPLGSARSVLLWPVPLTLVKKNGVILPSQARTILILDFRYHIVRWR